MNYANPDITNRAKESPLWKDLSEQNSKTLPYLVERYLLLENWRYRDRTMDSREHHNTIDDFSYVHMLLSEMATVLLSQEERIRKMEGSNASNKEPHDWKDCVNVQCKQVHNYLNTLMESLGIECPDNIYVIGKAIRISQAIDKMRKT